MNMFKKLLSFVLALIILLSMFTIGIPAAVADLSSVGVNPLTVTIDTGASVTISDNDGDGFYDIGTADDLYAFAELVDGGKTTIKGELTADIVVNEGRITDENGSYRSWDPIGGGSTQYATTFDGNGYSISGLYHVGTSSSYKGLFARVTSAAVIQNVTVKNSYIHADDSVGAIVGYSYGAVINCHSIDNILMGRLDETAKYTGGVVGYGNGTEVTGCTNTSTVYGQLHAGGIVGYATGATIITDCHNYGNVIADAQTGHGGIAGTVDNTKGQVVNCINLGSVEGKSQTGGVVGYNTGQVLNCINSGSVTGTSSYTGGIVGYNTRTITDCSNSGNVSGKGYVGGVAGYNYGSNADILTSSNTGSVSATANYCGGITGSNTSSSTIVSSYNIGSVTSTANYSGGISGSNNSSSILRNCYNSGTVTGNSYVGGITGYSPATCTGCYYLSTSASGGINGNDTSGKAEAKTAEQFASGEIAYTLQGTQTEQIWGQNIGEDPTPQLSDAKVYLVNAGCGGSSVQVYSNSPEDPDHNYVNGFCSVCDAYEPAVDSDSDGYYEIDNAGKLYWFAQQVNGGNTAIKLKLTKDIVINQGDITSSTTNARAWTPIGNDNEPFAGHFDGNSKSISGLYHKAAIDNAALVGNLENGGIISNVHVTNSYISGKGHCAIIAGDNYGTISGCSVTDSECVGSGDFVGGIAGYSSTTGRITECYNESTVSGAQYVGGIAGDNHGGADILNCYNTGDISSTSGYCGGIAGYNTSSGSTVTNCYTTGKVSGGTTYDGGVVGRNNEGTVKNCYFLNTAHAGGIDGGNVTGSAEAKTAEEFASGKVAYLLQGTQADEVWGQTVGEDKYPLLFDDKVYLVTTNCANETVELYANVSEITDHNYVNGFCTICDGYEPAKDTDSDGYYEIDNAGKLYWFAEQVNAGNVSINGKLTKNIVINQGEITSSSTGARAWTPIGSEDFRFAGHLDGNSKSISGLYHNSSNDDIGLVGYADAEALITNVNITNSYISANSHIGFIVAHNYGTIKGCSVTDSEITAIGNFVGGISGYSSNTALISECFNSSTVSGAQYVGGIAGDCHTSSGIINGGKILNCYNTGDVSSVSGYCGGIAGYITGDSVISNCYSTGTVSGSTDYAGIVVGSNNLGTITNCYYLDTVKERGIDGSDVTGSAEAKTAAEFASGEVAYLLQGTQTENIWGQTLGEDSYPLLHDDRVYYGDLSCADDSEVGYTNSASKPEHSYTSVVTPPTDTERGYTTYTCTVCSDSYVDDFVYIDSMGGVSGDDTLFEEADSTQPYIKLAKPSYQIESPILVTADYGTRLALYPGSVTAPTSSDKPVYTFDLEGHEGQVVDIRTGEYHSDSGVKPYLTQAKYNIFLFADDAYTVAAGPVAVNITHANVISVNANTYLETNRTVYNYGEPIVMKAKAASNANAWVGVYQKGANTQTTAPEYVILVGSGYSTRYSEVNTDVIYRSVVNTNMELEAGEYDIHLFADKNPTSTKLASLTFKVQYGTLSTDKTSYGYGEDIISVADTYNTSDVNIANTLVVAGLSSSSTTSGLSGTANNGNYVNSPGTVANGAILELLETSGHSTYNWARIKVSKKASYGSAANGTVGWAKTYLNAASGSDVKIYGVLTKAADLYTSIGVNTGLGGSLSNSSSKIVSGLPVGTAFNYLEYGNNCWIKVQVGGFTGWLFRSYTQQNEIKLTFRRHNTAIPTYSSEYERVGIYTSDATLGTTPSEGWYHLKNVNQRAVVLQDLSKTLASNTSSSLYPNGSHTLHLLGNDGYTDTVTKQTVTVSGAVTGEFINGAYELDTLSDGFANGRVALEIDTENCYGYVGNENTYAVIYWAGEDGLPLAGYKSFAKIPLDKNIVTFDMHPYSIIPEGATGLVAYVEFNGVQGTTGYVVELPEDAKTYSNLDKGIVSEFQILADAQLTSNEIEYDCNENYDLALRDIVNNSTKSAGIFISGDATYSGARAEFALLDSIKSSVESSTGKTVPPVYISLGDSDNDEEGTGYNAFIDYVNANGGSVSEDKLYYSTMISGYKFIFLACDAGDKELSVEQLEWLDDELADNKQENAGKPVFILLHDVLADTVVTPYGAITNTDEIAEVTKKYNNVYVFSGHNLYDLSSKNLVFGGDDTLPVVVSAGTVGFSRHFDGTGLTAFTDASSTGYYVRVYSNKIAILGRDFKTGNWIPEACCVLYNQDVAVTKDDVALSLTESINKEDYIKNDKNRDLSFISSDTDIVTVTEDGYVTPVAVGDTIPTHTSVIVTAAATNTEVVTRAELPLRIFEDIDRNYYVRGSFNNWEEGVVMEKSLDDDDLVTASLTFKRGIYEFKLNNFETWFENPVVIDNVTDDSGIVLTPRIQRENTRSTQVDNTTTLVALGGTYEFEYRISTNTLKIYHTSLLDEGGTAGDTSLLDKAASTEPYVVTSKEEFKLGESIYVTASGGTWVGIYKADTTDYENTYSSYWYYVEGCDGRPLDIRTLKYNAKDKTLDPIFYTGEYKAVLFGTNDQSQVLDEVYFDVVDANY
ncbi:MAG: hypothetical protein IJA62_00795, partial [Ruminococcus sp.]|nr:hypothetical protein [Ruminococcus sp.]